MPVLSTVYPFGFCHWIVVKAFCLDLHVVRENSSTNRRNRSNPLLMGWHMSQLSRSKVSVGEQLSRPTAQVQYPAIWLVTPATSGSSQPTPSDSIPIRMSALVSLPFPSLVQPIAFPQLPHPDRFFGQSGDDLAILTQPSFWVKYRILPLLDCQDCLHYLLQLKLRSLSGKEPPWIITHMWISSEPSPKSSNTLPLEVRWPGPWTV